MTHTIKLLARAGTVRSPWSAALMMAGLVVIAATSCRAEPAFTPSQTDACVAQAQAASPSLSGHAVLDCIGLSAQACMNSPGGGTTIGMIDCLQGELDYWDKRLNTAYAKRVAAAKQQDADLQSLKSAVPSIEESLRKMQRAWISYRDAACLYEQSQWQGGTGGGPATAGCQMNETARQALKLEGWWSQ